MNSFFIKQFLNHKWHLILLLFIGFMCLQNTLYNGWLNWDDTVYVLDNSLIKNLSWEGIKTIFTTLQINGSYNPVVLLSWGLDYLIGGEEAFYYHFSNLIIHLICSVFVYFLFIRLYQQKSLAFFAALFFNIHPMHISSVAWISARKELLYTLFYVISMLSYLNYLNSKRNRDYIFCFLFFVIACFSKGSAVTFPIILLLIDYFIEKKLFKNNLLSKVPFFVVSLLFLYLGVKGQSDGGALNDVMSIPWYHSVFVACYGYVMYIIKAIIPFKLSVFHPYPNTLGTPIPWFFYVCIIPILATLFFVIKNFKKERLLCFGIGFYFITLFLVIQLIPFGSAVISERFTYLPYLGVFIVIIELFKKILNNTLKKQFIAGVLIVVSVGFCLLNHNYIKTFKSTYTLWTHVITQYPDNFKGYLNRTSYYTHFSKWELAMKDTNKGLSLNSNHSLLYYNKGYILENTNKVHLAITAYTTAIAKSKGKNKSAYLNRGVCYFKTNQYQKALKDFNNYILLNPQDPFVYYNIGLIYKNINQYKKALDFFDKAILLNHKNVHFYTNRALMYSFLGNYKKSISDYSLGIILEPNDELLYEKRGNLYLNIKNLDLAIQDFKSVVMLNPKNELAFINLGFCYLNKHQPHLSLENLNKAIFLNAKNPLSYYNRGLLFKIQGQYKKASKDLEKAIELNSNYNAAKLTLAEVQLLLKSQ